MSLRRRRRHRVSRLPLHGFRGSRGPSVSADVAEHFADMIAMHRAPADYDSTDADLAAMAPTGPSVLEQHRGAWYLCADIESGAVAS